MRLRLFFTKLLYAILPVTTLGLVFFFLIGLFFSISLSLFSCISYIYASHSEARDYIYP